MKTQLENHNLQNGNVTMVPDITNDSHLQAKR